MVIILKILCPHIKLILIKCNMKVIFITFLMFVLIGVISGCNDNITPIVQPTYPDTIRNTIKVLKENQIDFDESTIFTYTAFNLVKRQLEFRTTAVGRASKLGLVDNPIIDLFNDSYTHPSIVYLKDSIGGYNFWLALTPYFGKILAHSDFTSFENPHIFRSKDGLNWEEPEHIKNPLDTPYVGPFISYWSDTNLIFYKNKLYCFYRGNGLPKNYFGDRKNHYRNIVYRVSDDGVNWSERTLLYSTLNKGLDDESGIVSPSFVYNSAEEKSYCYDVVFSSLKHPYASQKNQLYSFVMRRDATQLIGPYTDHGEDKICNFINKPWPDNHDPWHLEVKKYNGMYFMLLNTGLAAKSNGESLYFAYSIDGLNFRVLDQPIFKEKTYKSTFMPVEITNKLIKFYIYQSEKETGSINLYRLDLKYSNNGDRE